MKQVLSAWNNFWFKIEDTSPLELLRIGFGLLVFFHYLSLVGHVDDLLGTKGVIAPETASSYYEALIPVFTRWLSTDSAIRIFHALVMVCSVLFAFNFKPNLMKWFVWYGHYCLIKQNPYIVGGADRVVHSIILLLALAPLGKQRVRFSGWASACLRLIQIQICIVYFFAGTRKLEFPGWWSGDALWTALVDPQYTSGWASFFVGHYALINLACYVTLLFEIGYVFLITNKVVRPYLVIFAFVFHASIALFMGLYYFGFAMIFANFAFIEQRTRRLIQSIVPEFCLRGSSRYGRSVHRAVKSLKDEVK